MTIGEVISRIGPYVGSFLGSLILTLLLTPIVREVHRRIGMVDKPDPRRINKVPIPRGGGLAVVLSVVAICGVFYAAMGSVPFQGVPPRDFWIMISLAASIAFVGLLDDRFGLPPKVKLLGQLLVAFLVWFVGGFGFHALWPALPAWADCLMTVFWITGAINAFNLIDGLDGLASGLGFIASLAMAGTLFLTSHAESTFLYLILAGALLGFLRYNYHPASVFLGDSGSMFIGFMVATLPLATQRLSLTTSHSFLVSVGVPLLAMGVPIFDTFLAIVRRSIRRILNRREEAVDGQKGNDKVMTADADHLHHRLLRSSGLNQLKTAWILYAIALVAVAFGLIGMSLESRAAGLWLIAVAFASVIIFKNMARVELFDAGRLLNSVAHDQTLPARRRMARLTVPLLLTYDIVALAGVFVFICWIEQVPICGRAFVVALLIRVTAVLGCLIVLRAYRTVWGRAMLSNYFRLLLACLFGALIGTVIVYYAPNIDAHEVRAITVSYGLFSFVALAMGRVMRPFVRDMFYAFDCSRLKARKDVSRILVYGAGLRYRTFRRELVRRTSINNRIIVGLLDDNILLRGHYIGGVPILGPLSQAPSIINEVNADAVVIACEVTPEWREIIRQTLAPTGVQVTCFNFEEKPL